MWQKAVCEEEIIFGVVKLYDWGRKKLIGDIYSAYKFFNRWIFAKLLLCPVGNGFITEPKWLCLQPKGFLLFSQNALTFNLSEGSSSAAFPSLSFLASSLENIYSWARYISETNWLNFLLVILLWSGFFLASSFFFFFFFRFHFKLKGGDGDCTVLQNL